jgi:HEAT repeat protein
MSEEQKMDNTIISQINQLTDCIDGLPYQDVHSWIEQLSNPNGFRRTQARDVLSCIGLPVIPDLVQALEKADTQLRWEIIKVLEIIQDPSTVPVLVAQLMDDNAGVRWAASNALVSLRRGALPALFEALTRDVDSSRLRASAHHILHVLKDDGRLTEQEIKVYRALEDIEPTVAVPWAASRALQSIWKLPKK